MRRVALLGPLTLLAACHGPAPEAIPSPRPPRIVVLDSGMRVRADLRNGRKIIGRVLVATDAASRRLIVARDGDPAVAPDTLDIEALGALDVRGKSGGRWGLIGFYTGGLTGALIRKPDRTEDLGPMVLGMLGGALLGGLYGSHVETWIPIFPCYHGCYGPPQL